VCRKEEVGYSGASYVGLILLSGQEGVFTLVQNVLERARTPPNMRPHTHMQILSVTIGHLPQLIP
jgi:hypothetical protein